MNSQNRLRWEPAIYEHKAALVGRSLLETSRSAELLFEALRAEHEVYGADVLTVGIDIYNLEAEACGARVEDIGPTECPDIAAPLAETGANVIVCDFSASAREFARTLERQGRMAVRRNIRPSDLEASERLAEVASRYAEEEFACHDRAYFHLDGPGALRHLDDLLAIRAAGCYNGSPATARSPTGSGSTSCRKRKRPERPSTFSERA